jgi:invasion protein IalB
VSRSILKACLCAVLAAACAAVRAEPSDGQSFKDWTARCETLQDGTKVPCYIFQNLLLKKDNQRLLHVAVGYLAEGDKPVAFFSLPLGVSLPGGLSVTVDEGQPLRLRYERCEPNGCLAPLPLDDQLIRSLKGGRWARVAFFDTTRREISVPVSLLGFTAGFDALGP